MSRILRRPMFRGGPVSSYGTGIASGLGYELGGRVGYQRGGGTGSYGASYSAAPAGITGAQIVNFIRNNPKFGGLDFGGQFTGKDLTTLFNPNRTYSPISLDQPGRGSVASGRGAFSEGDVTSTPEFLKLYQNIISGDTSMASLPGETTESDTSDTTTSEVVSGNIVDEFAPSSKKPAEKKPEKEPEILPPEPEKEESVDYTVEDYIKLLGGDKARRRDLGDMFGRASAAFFGEGDVRSGIAKFMEAESKAGPSRLEKIETAAGTLDIKDKIQSKRSKENIDLMKEKVMFELGAKSAALKEASNIKNMNASDGLTYIAEKIYRGGKDRSSSRVLKTFIDIKLDTDANIKNVGNLNDFKLDDLLPGVTIVTSNQGKRVYFKKGNDVKQIDINQL
jgi:hypothetical protein